MKRNFIRQILIAVAMIATMPACTKENNVPELEDGVSTVIRDLEGDIGNTVGSGKPFEPFYFSFKTGAKVESNKKVSTEWDIAFAKEYNSYVSINNGTSDQSFGFGAAGKGAMIVVNKAYNQVTEAPSDAEFTNNAITSAGWDSGAGNGWYFYELKTHIAVPVINRTYVLRTAEGKYAKLQLISMYKGAPATVSDLNWPAPYFTFRYYVQQDGSRNLLTAD
ncbi:HmuY family protein [Pedobacter sp. MR2016-24]|uniref:HmuY family protein n=1 Tax=Pedobacter sp. MR2016-24 TaxID=2994466 RepID=UPI0022482894|nr:HmuY family protein [Pedobacter sp. MR2016-24]MCX2482253.1 HmuY family protein [Pedobacter sp. MR2016-24]